MHESPAILIRIPTPLRTYTLGADMVAVNGDSVAQALAALGQQHPGILDRILDQQGKLSHFVSIYLGAANIVNLGGLETHLETDDVLAIIPAVAGGAE